MTTDATMASQDATARRLGQSRVEMEDAVHALGDAWRAVAERLPHEVSPATARAVQARENRWVAVAREFGMLTSGQAAETCGLTPSNRQWAADQRAAGRLLGVRRGSRVLYPGFQLTADGSLRPIIERVAELGRQAGWSEPGMLLWFTAPSTAFIDDKRPVDLLDDEPEAVLEAARAKFFEQW